MINIYSFISNITKLWIHDIKTQHHINTFSLCCFLFCIYIHILRFYCMVNNICMVFLYIFMLKTYIHYAVLSLSNIFLLFSFLLSYGQTCKGNNNDGLEKINKKMYNFFYIKKHKPIVINLTYICFAVPLQQHKNLYVSFFFLWTLYIYIYIYTCVFACCIFVLVFLLFKMIACTSFILQTYVLSFCEEL